MFAYQELIKVINKDELSKIYTPAQITLICRIGILYCRKPNPTQNKDKKFVNPNILSNQSSELLPLCAYMICLGSLLPTYLQQPTVLLNDSHYIPPIYLADGIFVKGLSATYKHGNSNWMDLNDLSKNVILPYLKNLNTLPLHSFKKTMVNKLKDVPSKCCTSLDTYFNNESGEMDIEVWIDLVTTTFPLLTTLIQAIIAHAKYYNQYPTSLNIPIIEEVLTNKDKKIYTNPVEDNFPHFENWLINYEQTKSARSR
jgi:hypothetical protein